MCICMKWQLEFVFYKRRALIRFVADIPVQSSSGQLTVKDVGMYSFQSRKGGRPSDLVNLQLFYILKNLTRVRIAQGAAVRVWIMLGQLRNDSRDIRFGQDIRKTKLTHLGQRIVCIYVRANISTLRLLIRLKAYDGRKI